MIDADRCAEVARRVAQARRDLGRVEALIEQEGDCLVALALLSRAAKSADDAIFILLDARAAEADAVGSLSGSPEPRRAR